MNQTKLSHRINKAYGTKKMNKTIVYLQIKIYRITHYITVELRHLKSIVLVISIRGQIEF